MKFSKDVVKLWCECSLICPFNARCTPTIAPAIPPAVTANIERLLASIRSQTDTKTAKTVKIAASTRRGEISFLPPPVKPMRSTINDIAVCPAIDATE